MSSSDSTPTRPTSSAPPRTWPALVTVISLASLPFLALIADNVGEGLDMGRVGLWWAVTVVIGLAVLALGFSVSRKAGAWVGAAMGVFLFLFFNARGIAALQERFGITWSAGTWWLAVAAVVMAVAIPVTRKAWAQLFLGIAAPALLVMPLVEFAGAQASEPTVTDTSSDSDTTLVHKPNVWYFMSDGHAGAELLREVSDYDPTEFLDALRQEGFDVSEQARSNYPFTHLSVSTALEMDYTYEGVDEPSPGPFFDILQGDNRTVDTFLDNGYSYVHAYPGFWNGSQCGGREDICLGDHGPISETDWVLASMTPLAGMVTDLPLGESIATTSNPLYLTNQILAGAPQAPYFVFAHLLSPHPPLLRAADCSIRDIPLKLSGWGHGPEYGAAAQCLDTQMLATAKRILSVDPDAVIIFQGDHGPRFEVNYTQPGGQLLDEDRFFSILSAIHLPDYCADIDIPDDVSPVNTFRLVFACLTDQPPDLLPYQRFPIRREW